MQIGSVSNGITLNSNGDLTFNGTITLPAGTDIAGLIGSLDSAIRDDSAIKYQHQREKQCEHKLF